MPASNNNRIFYACQAVALHAQQANAQTGALSNYGAATVLHGVQSVGINTTFNLEQVFELGQIHIYENIEGVPDVEVTLEKVLDGYPLMYHVATSAVATDTSTTGAAKAALVARTKYRCNVGLGIFSDTVSHVGDDNSNPIEVLMSGMYVSSIGYTIPVDGNATESLTLVGNHKQWNTTPTVATSATVRTLTSGTNYYDGPGRFTTGGGPLFRGGVQRRENVALNYSVLPASIKGVVGVGTGNAWTGGTSPTGVPRVHLQNISISCDLNRESVQELGRKAPYTRYANFPVEVTCEIEALCASGDFVQALEEGIKGGTVNTVSYALGTENYGNNTPNETILIRLHDGTCFDLGNKNRLSSINYTGGDAGGGNVTTTYSYSTFNALSVFHPADPAGNTVAPVGGFRFNGQ